MATLFVSLAGASVFALATLTCSPSHPPKLAAGTVVDSLAVTKSKRQLRAYSNGRLVMTSAIQLGHNPSGHKQHQGDYRTPEGLYRINGKNPNSQYHKNLGISYPNQQDRARARKLGRDPGGDVKVHGFPSGVDTEAGLPNWGDWTWGCIAMTNEEIDALYEAVPIGTPIYIQP